MAHKVRVHKVYDIRPKDIETGKPLAITKDEWWTCQCCGKKIAIVHELTNGDFLGVECANILPHTRNGQDVTKSFGLSKKQDIYFKSLQS